MEEWGDNDVIKVADYIDQNKAQYFQKYAEKKRKLDAFRNKYKQSMQKQHDAVTKYQQSLNKTQQTNNQTGYKSGSFNNTSTQNNNKPSSSQTNRQPTYSRNNQQRSYNNNTNKGNLRLGTTFIVDDDE